jgi:hypothetical protein
VPCARVPALLPSTSTVASRQDVFTVVIASASRTRFRRHAPYGTGSLITHMKSLTKINGANHASGYKSVAKFAQGPRGEDGLRYLCGSEQGGAGTSAVAAPHAHVREQRPHAEIQLQYVWPRGKP